VSELEYLLEALESEHISHWNHPAAVVDIKDGIRRAIELRDAAIDAADIAASDKAIAEGGDKPWREIRETLLPTSGGDVTNRDRALRGEVVKVADGRLLEMQRQAVTNEGIAAEPVYHWHWAAAINELIAVRQDFDRQRELLREAAGILETIANHIPSHTYSDNFACLVNASKTARTFLDRVGDV